MWNKLVWKYQGNDVYINSKWQHYFFTNNGWAAIIPKSKVSLKQENNYKAPDMFQKVYPNNSGKDNNINYGAGSLYQPDLTQKIKEADDYKFEKLVELIKNKSQTEWWEEFLKKNLWWVGDKFLPKLRKMWLSETADNLEQVVRAWWWDVNFKVNDRLLRDAGISINDDWTVNMYWKKIQKDILWNIARWIVSDSYPIIQDEILWVKIPSFIKKTWDKLIFKYWANQQTNRRVKEEKNNLIKLDEKTVDIPSYKLWKNISRWKAWYIWQQISWINDRLVELNKQQARQKEQERLFNGQILAWGINKLDDKII